MSEGEIDWQISFLISRVILNVDNVDKRIPLVWTALEACVTRFATSFLTVHFLAGLPPPDAI
jgi:hypothetical protein